MSAYAPTSSIRRASIDVEMKLWPLGSRRNGPPVRNSVYAEVDFWGNRTDHYETKITARSVETLWCIGLNVHEFNLRGVFDRRNDAILMRLKQVEV